MTAAGQAEKSHGGDPGQPERVQPEPGLLRGSAGPLSQEYDVALLDLDGVVYLGPSAVPGAPEALAKAAGSGMRLAFVTNNSSRTPSAIAAQISSFGVPAAASDVVTSAQAAATLLAGRLDPGAAVLVIGGNGLRIAVRDRGFRPRSSRASPPASATRCSARGRWPSRPGPGSSPPMPTRRCPPPVAANRATAPSPR